jgi:hypothetical protein
VIEIALAQSESVLDTSPGSPHDHDQPTEPPAMRSVASRAHNGDDLFDLRRIGRVAQTLVAWSVAGVESRHRRRRPAPTGTIERKLGHDPSSARRTNLTIGAGDGRPPSPTVPAIASDTEQRSKPTRDGYRGCRIATLDTSTAGPLVPIIRTWNAGP